MGNKPSILKKLSISKKHNASLATTKQQPSVPPPIFAIITLDELFTLTVSFMKDTDTKHILALASTCKYINDRYKKIYETKIFTLLHDLKSMPFIRLHYIEILKNIWNKTGIKPTKVEVIEAPVNSQDYYQRSAGILHSSNGLFKMLDGWSYRATHTLILDFSLMETKSKLDVSFFGKLPNLVLLGLEGANVNNDMVSTLSNTNFRLLKFLCLLNCIILEQELSKLLENCTTIEYVQLLGCWCSGIISIKLPLHIKGFKVKDLEDISAVKFNLSLSTQLECL
jgi:hypothetical protein